MAGHFIQIDTDGIDDVKATLRKVDALTGSLGDILGAVGAAAESVILLRFVGEHGPGGIPWPKSKRALGLAPNIRGKKQAGRTLVDSGELQNSLKVEVGDREVSVGFRGLHNPKKATANQFGSSGTSIVTTHARTIKSAFGIPLPEPRRIIVSSYGRINRLPARPMLGLDDEMTHNIREVASTYLLNLIGKR